MQIFLFPMLIKSHDYLKPKRISDAGYNFSLTFTFLSQQKRGFPTVYVYTSIYYAVQLFYLELKNKRFSQCLKIYELKLRINKEENSSS